MALHFLNRYQIMVIKVPSKFDLRRLCRATGATPLARMVFSFLFSFSPSFLFLSTHPLAQGAPIPEEIGSCDLVETIEIGSDLVTVFRQSIFSSIPFSLSLFIHVFFSAKP